MPDKLSVRPCLEIYYCVVGKSWLISTKEKRNKSNGVGFFIKGVSTEIIKNNRDADITPSAVYIKKGNIRRGEAAKSRFVDEEDDVYLEFKRRMGTDHVYKFRSSGQ